MFYECRDHGKAKPAPAAVSSKDENVVTLTDAQLKKCTCRNNGTFFTEDFLVLKLNGMIDVPPQNLVSVAIIPLGGYLKSSSLLPGKLEIKGQVIAVIENPQFIQLQQDYLMAKSKIILPNWIITARNP